MADPGFVRTRLHRCLASLLLISTLTVCVSAMDQTFDVTRQEAQTSTADPWHATDVYVGETPGLVEPTLLKDAKPNYSSAAMRARIEGMVRLECIVELNGAIGAVRVRHSLDAVNGLDAEAIRTVRKWRFKPATKDGIPVRRAIEVEISFSLGAAYRPQLEWPVDLRRPEHEAPSPDRFAKEALTVANLTIEMKYPRDWTATKEVSGDQLIALQRITDHETRACSLLKPRSVEMDMMVPVRPGTLEAYAKTIKQEIANDPTIVELVRVGQVGAGRYWIWTEMTRQKPDFSSLPADAAAQMQAAFDGMRIWKFLTTDWNQELSVVCYLFTPRGASKDDLQEGARRAGADFAAIISGISIRPQ